MNIGFHASHEQFAPSHLLALVRRAEEAGFDSCLSSDHFRPWNERQGQSGHSWSWLGAALSATSLPFGVVCAPGQRYHPAIVAQASATLAEMFPGRLFVALGSGQHLNEGITRERWPEKAERNARLLECVEIIRALWAGDTVNRREGLVSVEQARLFTRPEEPPTMIGAALTPATAKWAGGWADGLITISRPMEELHRMVDAFHEGGGETKPMFLKVQVSYGRSDEEALAGAWDQWRSAVFDSSVLAELRSPAQLDAAASFVTPEQMHEHVRISSSSDMFVDCLSEYQELGFEHLYVHNVNREQELFLDVFGAEVLPRLRQAAS